MARTLYRSLTERLLSLPDHLLLYPAHYSGSVCGRGLSGNPASSIGFDRRHNAKLFAALPLAQKTMLSGSHPSNEATCVRARSTPWWVQLVQTAPAWGPLAPAPPQLKIRGPA
jgi:hypothetical protein